jgi:hypothetical protein
LPWSCTFSVPPADAKKRKMNVISVGINKMGVSTAISVVDGIELTSFYVPPPTLAPKFRLLALQVRLPVILNSLNLPEH